MADPELQLSVVVATFNRAETLRRTLSHLADQDLDPRSYEVLVIDDGSVDHTRRLIEETASALPFSLSYLHHSNRGPGYTQNRGIQQAKAPIVLLIADDILLTRQALRAHLEAHQTHPEIEAAVLGCVIQSPLLDQSVFLRTWDSFRFSDFADLHEVPYYRFWACNISLKRDFMLRHGLYRESIGRAGPASHEDPELGYRLHRVGLLIYYCVAALGHHYHIVTREGACKRAYQQGLNFDEFRAQTGAPEIAVAYRDLRWRTVGDHLRTWFGPNRRYLCPADRSPLTAIFRHLIRGLVFNRVTIRFVWNPVFDRAEHDPRVASLMRPVFYRGLVAYHFFKGCREGNRRFGVPRAECV